MNALLQFWRSGFGRLLLGLVFVVGGVVLFGKVAGGLVESLDQSRRWIKQPEFSETSRENEDLFRELTRDGVVWFDPAGPAMRSLPCEALFDTSLATARPGAPPLKPALLERLCTQPAGRQILAEILAWNSSFLIAAARDDRAAEARCANGQALDLPVTPPGCRPTQWQAEAVSEGGGAGAPLNVIPGATPPPRDFADFALRRSGQASDWALFGPLRDPAQRLKLLTRLPAGQRRLTVDLILTPQRVSVGRESANVDPKRESFTVRLGGLAIQGERVCDEDEFDLCQQAADKGLPQGWRLTVTGRRIRDIELAVEGLAVSAAPAVAQAVLSDSRPAATGRARLWRSAHIDIDCNRTGVKLDCDLDWRTPVTQQRRGGGGRSLLFADGSPALDASGKPAPAVDEMGLTSLIGYGPSDIGSLASAAGGARTREQLKLTIEPRLQRMAQEAVYKQMGARLEQGFRRRRIGPDQASLPPEREPPDQGHGRAAVVLIDAGDSPGEILAMSSWPDFQAGMHNWDVQALAAGREADSPLAGHAWRAGDVHAMPGSTFKLVTGLAGIAAVKDLPWAAGVVSGREAPASQMRRLNIGAAALNVDGVTIGNYGGGAFSNTFLPPGPGGSGCPSGGAGAQIGVCESLIKSSNLWFAGLALALDADKVTARPPARPSGRSGTRLAAAVERIFPIYQAPGGPAGLVPGSDRRGLDLTRGIVTGAPRLFAEPVELAVEDKRNARRIDLATNSYGQGVRATPLAMAAIYGSVGARRVISPRILKPVSDVRETPGHNEGQRIIPGMDAMEDKPWLDMVDAGLQGVVNSPYGTATRVMAQLPPAVRGRIYAKTGTADTSEGMNSAWLAGWVNEVAGRRRVAFACWVTHTTLTGGGACGALMAPLLAKLADDRGR
ncbi:MAG: penicillin-binding transpeptidase domain-containing protein [Beijerinckiaceae bacterium]